MSGAQAGSGNLPPAENNPPVKDVRVPHVYWLATMILLGGLLRFLVAPSEGLKGDIATFEGWARSAATFGVAQSYSEQLGDIMLPNYPPFSMLVIAGLGQVQETLFSPSLQQNPAASRVLIKTPAILADLLTAVVLFLVLNRSLGSRAARIGSAVYAFNPAVWYNSAVWGQMDSVFTLLILGALACAMGRRWAWCGIWAALALLTKAQAVIILPVLAVAMTYRWKALVPVATAALSTVAVVMLPFLLGGRLVQVLNVYLNSVGFYPVLTFNAYNIWYALYNGQQPESSLMFNLASYRSVGLAIFGAVTGWLLVSLRRTVRDIFRSNEAGLLLVLVTSLIAYAFFQFNTEMHERYLFPFIALGLPLLFISRRAAVYYCAASLLFFLNLLGVLPWTAIDRSLFRELTHLPSFIGTAHLFLFIGCLVEVMAYMRRIHNRHRDRDEISSPAAQAT